MSEKMNVPKLRFKEFSGEWEEKRLGSISFRSAKKNKDNQSNEVFTNSAINGIVSQRDYFDKDIANQNNLEGYYIVNKDDFIYNPRISNFAPVGPLNRNHLATGVMSPLYTVFKIKDTIVNLDFIERYFHTTKWHRYMNNIANYGARSDRMNITNNDFIKMPIPLPSKQEQEKIASFLTSVDTKIEQLTKKKALLEQYKKGVMQKIFSQEIRFRDDDGGEFSEWVERKISQIFEITRGNVLAVPMMSQEKNDDFQYPVYSSQTKNNGLTGYYNEYLFEDCITWTTDGANAGDANLRRGKFYCTNVCGVLKSDKGYANQFIAEILNSVTKKHVSYVGNPKLMNNTMGGIKITIPSSIEEQTKIANFLSSLDTKISQIEQQLESTKQFKKALLQQMFV
ncbi:MAG TPA: restriction endonuclease subunit S [Sulfurovum sp. UBA12169]|nr:MAG TPA: restriction endonuclease subunit S [Sulfurovum sp. UBA12169]